jgi:hypothetical protein
MTMTTPNRMISIVALCLGPVLAGCGDPSPSPTGGGDPPEKKAPRLEADPDQDVGEADYGKTYTGRFRVANIGGSPLVLTLARKSCACSQVEVEPAAGIPPGQEGKVVMRWTPVPGQHGRLSGPTALTADFLTNDPNQPSLRLELRGRVNPKVRLSPKEWWDIDFGPFPRGRVVRRDLRVFSTVLPAFGLTVKTSHPGLTVTKEELSPNELVEDQRIKSGYRVVVETSDRLPRGPFRETLTLEISGPEARAITLPLFGEVDAGAVHAEPKEVLFIKQRVTEGDSKTVMVRFLGASEAEKVELVKYEPAFLKVDPPRRVQPRVWLFTVRLPADNAEAARFQADRFFDGKVLLKTSAGEVNVRVKWVPPDPPGR